MALVSVFMDVEDPVNLLADDAAMDFAELFTSIGVRGSFCITGEKCRKLLERGRRDVIESLEPHCLGLHTDTHSQHPTTMELLADLDYEVGCVAAFHAESQGAESFLQAFGRKPSFWGGAGNTWSPEICHAMTRLGIQAYAYSLTEMPQKAVHRFNGVMALPQSVWYEEDEIAAHVPSGFPLRSDWTGIFVGHPTRYRYPDYWDRSYYSGQTPEEVDLLQPVLDEHYCRAKLNLRELLCRLSDNAQIIGVDDLLRMEWRLRKPTPLELDHFHLNTPLHIRKAGKWPPHRADLDVSGIVSKTLSLADTLRVAELA